MGVILLIFTGQVWNLAFSFYSSLKSIPREMVEASRIYRYSAWQRFWQLEMPYAAIGLVWNSIVSVAGGWFALIACEMFTMGDRNFQLPGLGSYLQTATNSGDMRALLSGIAAVILIVVATDQLVWRPLIAWSDKFKFEQVESADRVSSPSSRCCAVPTCSVPCPAASGRASKSPSIAAWPAPKSAASSTRSTKTEAPQGLAGPVDTGRGGRRRRRLGRNLQAVLMLSNRHLARSAACCWRALPQPSCASTPPCSSPPPGPSRSAWPSASTPGWRGSCSPLAQVLASVPATAFFPILLIGLVKIGGGLGIGSIALMLLGTQWYILFNVIAGAMSIPSDLREVASLYRFTRWQRWTRLILPGIFPYLITGMVTASGGAWNASVYGRVLPRERPAPSRPSAWARKSDAATDSGRFPILLLATIFISLMVVTMNRLVWRRLYRLAETRYKLEG